MKFIHSDFCRSSHDKTMQRPTLLRRYSSARTVPEACTQRAASRSRAFNITRGAEETRNKAPQNYNNHKVTEQKKLKSHLPFFFPPPARCVSPLLGTRPSLPCLFWHPAGNSFCQVIIQGSHMYHLNEIKLIVFLLKVSFPQRKLIHLLSCSPSGDQENKKKKVCSTPTRFNSREEGRALVCTLLYREQQQNQQKPPRDHNLNLLLCSAQPSILHK